MFNYRHNRFQRTVKNSTIFYYLLCSLLLNSFASFFTAASVLANVNAADNGDAVIICTGKQFRWVSQSAFEQTGKLVYVDAPTNQQVPVDNQLCPIGLVADHQSPSLSGHITHLHSVENVSELVITFTTVSAFQPSFFQPLNRAPPAFFLFHI